MCTDPSLKKRRAFCRSNQANKTVPVRMRMTVETPVWILDASGNEEKNGQDITVTGFEKPVCLDPQTLRL